MVENNEVEVMVEICREGVVLPTYAKPGDAGMDICAAVESLIAPGETVIVPTGIKLAIPEGYEIQVRPRSGVSFKTPLRIANSPGTIDEGYRDELGIIVTNISEISSENAHFTIGDKKPGKGTYILKQGDRIAQLVLQRVPKMKLTVVSSVAEIGMNRGGGFGSTGMK